MNFKKLSLIAFLLIPSFFLARVSTAQEAEQAEQEAEEAEQEEISQNEDRSYFADFAKEKPYLHFVHDDENLKKRTEYVLVDIETNGTMRNFVMAFASDESQQMIVKESDKSLTFKYFPSEEYSKFIQDLLIEEDIDGAIEQLRKNTYALLSIMDTGEEMFPIRDTIYEYVDLLTSARRKNELYSLFEFFDYDKMNEEFYDAAVVLAKIFAEDGDFEKTLKILEVLNIEVKRKDLIPDLMEILTIFRDAKRIEDISRFYSRLLAIPDNKLALEAKMWALYCDIQRGNVLTAKIMLENFGKVDKRLPEYSLYKLIKGLIEKDAKNATSALEDFSEGIVYGKSVDDWMPELMYNTALGYFVAGEGDVAMQIVEEMRKFYPENLYLAMAESDIKVEN